MQNFSLDLKSRGRLTIRDSFLDHRIRLDRLAELTGGTVEEDVSQPGVILLPEAQIPAHACQMQKWNSFGVYFLPEEKTILIALNEEKWSGNLAFLVHLWQISIRLAVYSAVFCGSDLLLVHGALLNTARGGVLLCGQSGMGKSTTSRRWQAAGETVLSDDMILLEFLDGTILAHPLPTWSRCRVSLDGEYFPFFQTVPLQRVIALARGAEQEEFKAVSEAEYFMSIYSGCVFFYSAAMEFLPEEQRDFLMCHVRSRAMQLTRLSPPAALFAHLDGDLKETLRDFLP